MMFLYSLLLAFLGKIYSPSALSPPLTTTECYQTISIYSEFIIISHHFPTGPKYLFVKLELQIYSSIFTLTPRVTRVQYHLKRVNGPCNNSLMFSTMGENFIKMIISMSLYLYYELVEFAKIHYIFNKGFRPSFYWIFDENANLGVYINILDVKDEQYISFDSSWEMAKSYIESLSKNVGELCVLTDYNIRVILKPYYKGFIPQGLITSIKIEFSENEEKLSVLEYPAFDCYKNREFPEERVVFIADGKIFELGFKVFFWSGKSNPTLKEAKFIPGDVEFADIVFLHKLHRGYQKVFLIKKEEEILNCTDGTQRILSKLKNGTAYLSKELKNRKFLNAVEQTQWIYHPASERC